MVAVETHKAGDCPTLWETPPDQALVPIVYVSHVFSEIERLSGKAVLMSEGKVLAAGRASEATPNTE
jgi:ABC-type molybdate transport system ATPase subunit